MKSTHQLEQPDTPLPAVSPRLIRWFCWYAPRYIRRHFDVVRLLGAPPDTGGPRPILVYCNHPSWWDPMAIVLLIGRYFAHRPGYGPMDVKGLERYRFMEKLGFFGIDPDNRSGAERFLRLGAQVLRTPGQTLWVTAEGHFTDPRKRPVALRRGVAHLARKAEGAVAIPLAIEYGFGLEKKPEMRLCFGEPIALGDRGLTTRGWDRRLSGALESTMDRLDQAGIGLMPGDGSSTADTEGFTTLLDARGGMGGVYGWWQRVRSIAQRKPHRASHAEAAR